MMTLWLWVGSRLYQISGVYSPKVDPLAQKRRLKRQRWYDLDEPKSRHAMRPTTVEKLTILQTASATTNHTPTDRSATWPQ